ncbi:MAG: cation diffusion facilitator family transporter [Oscillospiraceae bacterium]|nr:cation diffusion facilitator family transporter [Oscillospiraceae bacterium]
MKTSIDKKTKYIKLAAMIALLGNVILASMKIAAGIFSQSNALVGAGIDSSTDVLISIITLVVVKILSKPADANHPWGHRKAETIATAFLSFIIFFAGAQLIINSLTDLIAGIDTPLPPPIAIIVLIISVAGKILLAVSQYILGKRADSAMIKANAKNMASDVLISLGVLVGFAIAHLTGSGLADSIMAILIGFWIIRTAISIFADANLELMDGNSDMESYRIIVDSVNAVEGASTPHRARMRRIGGFWDISFDINVDPNCSVAEAHVIVSNVEKEIKKRLENVMDIMIHVEPHGDKSAEGFGLSEKEIKNGKAE